MRNTLIALAASTMLASSAYAQTEPGRPVFRVPLQGPASATSASPVYMWEQQAGACSTTCGTGVRITTNVCQDANAPDLVNGGFGPPEPDASCTASVGPKPSDSSAACTVYTGCTFDWVKPPETVTAVPGRPGCGVVRRQFSPRCERSDGTVMSASDHELCSNDMPDYNDVAANAPGALGYDNTSTETSACNSSDNTWVTGAWSSWSSTCSDTASRTRTVVCQRSFDGSVQADANCAGPKPATTDTQGVYSSCSYNWQSGAWSAWSSTCSASATQTRTVTCQRSDGTTVADASCSGAGAKPATSQSSAQYGGCTYSWQASGWSAWDSTCSGSATQTRSVWCQRSDGTTVADASCSGAGVKPVTSQSSAQYGGCSYAWQTGGWSAFNSSCSSTATRTRAVTCQRSDGSTVADASCTAPKPATSDTQAQYGGCSYTPSYGSWSACSAGSQSRSITCTRSDGATVPTSNCGFAGDPTSESQACSSGPVCGSANGVSTSTPPTTGMCSDGSTPTVTQDTSWHWTCGTNSCSAPITWDGNFCKWKMLGEVGQTWYGDPWTNSTGTHVGLFTMEASYQSRSFGPTGAITDATYFGCGSAWVSGSSEYELQFQIVRATGQVRPAAKGLSRYAFATACGGYC